MQKAGIAVSGERISKPGYADRNLMPAIVPGTVLTSLVADKIYPDPYFGDNNRIGKKLIPDIADSGREFYHYWFRTSFFIPASMHGKRIWLKFHGINYRSHVWVNGKKVGEMAGMFNSQSFDITNVAFLTGKNVLAVDVEPVDHPGSYAGQNPNRTGAVGENHNGGDGEIGKDVTMLMSVGWDFTAPDGVRDRNTGIWRDVELYATGDVVMSDPFVQTKLNLPDTTIARQTVSVEVKNNLARPCTGRITGIIKETGASFSKTIHLGTYETSTVTFTPEEYHTLIIKKPALWWPVNKGRPNLYHLQLKFTQQDRISHQIETTFGIRELTSDQNTPDRSRRFIVNGRPIFIRGTNWIPEAMLKNSEERTYAELRYTRQSGVNLLRLWGGGVAESDYFYELCDQMGLLVWNEFWITGDTHMPVDTALYLRNVAATVKRIRNHPSVAYYVASNESKEVPGTGDLIARLDLARGYQVQSECCGVHDGSPYKYENPMQYFENTASKRGSRVDGFNPEYGTPCIPIVESLRKMMPAKDLWPINNAVWNYLDGNGFHQVTTKYREAVNAFGVSSSIEEFAKKAQLVGAMNFRSIWEVWNYNKFNYGDRWASGFLFWYHNSPLPQVASRMYDWHLEPTAALYYSQNGLQPLHPQYDYLKNTVSVYNDYLHSFKNYTVQALVYDLQSKLVASKKANIDIPADGLAKDVLKIDFPDTISQVHFIKLILKDARGGKVSDAFYWRSKSKYEGAWTMTGPAVSGFEQINQLPATSLEVKAKMIDRNGHSYIRSMITNRGKALAFFIQLKAQNNKGENIARSVYSDNFFSLLPGEQKIVIIELPEVTKSNVKLISDAFNTQKLSIKVH